MVGGAGACGAIDSLPRSLTIESAHYTGLSGVIARMDWMGLVVSAVHQAVHWNLARTSHFNV